MENSNLLSDLYDKCSLINADVNEIKKIINLIDDNCILPCLTVILMKDYQKPLNDFLPRNLENNEDIEMKDLENSFNNDNDFLILSNLEDLQNNFSLKNAHEQFKSQEKNIIIAIDKYLMKVIIHKVKRLENIKKESKLFQKVEVGNILLSFCPSKETYELSFQKQFLFHFQNQDKYYTIPVPNVYQSTVINKYSTNPYISYKMKLRNYPLSKTNQFKTHILNEEIQNNKIDDIEINETNKNKYYKSQCLLNNIIVNNKSEINEDNLLIKTWVYPEIFDPLSNFNDKETWYKQSELIVKNENSNLFEDEDYSSQIKPIIILNIRWRNLIINPFSNKISKSNFNELNYEVFNFLLPENKEINLDENNISSDFLKDYTRKINNCSFQVEFSNFIFELIKSNLNNDNMTDEFEHKSVFDVNVEFPENNLSNYSDRRDVFEVVKGGRNILENRILPMLEEKFNDLDKKLNLFQFHNENNELERDIIQKIIEISFILNLLKESTFLNLTKKFFQLSNISSIIIKLLINFIKFYINTKLYQNDSIIFSYFENEDIDDEVEFNPDDINENIKNIIKILIYYKKEFTKEFTEEWIDYTGLNEYNFIKKLNRLDIFDELSEKKMCPDLWDIILKQLTVEIILFLLSQKITTSSAKKYLMEDQFLNINNLYLILKTTIYKEQLQTNWFNDKFPILSDVTIVYNEEETLRRNNNNNKLIDNQIVDVFSKLPNYIISDLIKNNVF
jgi:hypothetical protein